MSLGPRNVALAVLGVILAIVLVTYIAAEVAPDFFVGQGKVSQEQRNRLEARRGISTIFLAVVAGMVALVSTTIAYFALRNSRETLDLTRRSANAERFQRAVEQTGAEHMHQRLGGLWALQQISRDEPEQLHRPTVEVLLAYIRDRSPWPTTARTPRLAFSMPPDEYPGNSPSDEGLPLVTADINIALLILAQRDSERDEEVGIVLDLSQTNLSGVNVSDLSLANARLPEAYVYESTLPSANLRGANLTSAKFRGTKLCKADLRGATMLGTIFDGCDLTGADLRDTGASRTLFNACTLDGADLSGGSFAGKVSFPNARFVGATCVNTMFAHAGFEGADLTSADLQGAVLSGVHLSGVLIGTDLRDAHLYGAILTQASGLESANLEGAKYDDATQWPDGFDYRRRTGNGPSQERPG